MNLAMLAQASGFLDEAKQQLEEAVTIFRTIGDDEYAQRARERLQKITDVERQQKREGSR